MKTMILKVGYTHVAFPGLSEGQISGIVAALAAASEVNQCGDAWVPADTSVEISFVDPSRILVNNEVESLRAQLKEAKESSQQYSSYWLKANSELAELRKAQTTTITS